MAHATPTRRTRQVHRLQQQLAQAPALPFADVLPAEEVEQVLRDEKVSFRDRLFSPLVTLWVFLSQVLDPDHSCRAAVARFLAGRAARRLPPCSSNTSAYCKARGRLPEGLRARLTRETGRRVQDEIDHRAMAPCRRTRRERSHDENDRDECEHVTVAPLPAPAAYARNSCEIDVGCDGGTPWVGCGGY